MVCPRCLQGQVAAVCLNALNRTAYLCEECDALWFQRERIASTTWVDFGTFMEAQGHRGTWAEVTILSTPDNL